MSIAHKKKRACVKQLLAINALIKNYEQNYAVSDKQDVLAMCALQFASKLEISQLEESATDTEVLKKIKALTQLVNTHLE